MEISGAVLDMFLEHSPAAAFLRDSTGVYLWVNRAYAELYDVGDPAGMVGRDVFAFDPPLLAAMYLESDQEVLRSGTVLRHTLPMPRPDGVGEAAGHRFCVPLPDGGTGVGGIYTDVTELHQAQDEVRRYEALFQRTTVALAVLTTSGRVQEANPAFAALVGRPAGDLADIQLSDLIGPEAVDSVLAVKKHASGGVRTTVGVRLPNGTGCPAIASSTIAPGGLTVVLALQPLPTMPRTSPVSLSDKETTLIELLALGVDNATIASRMGLSRQGLDYHIRRLRRRLGATARADLVARAYATGVLDPSSWPPRVAG